MNPWIVYTLVVLGVRYVVGTSAILSVPRIVLAHHVAKYSRWVASFVHDGLTCPSCLGFWVGIASAELLPGASRYAWILSGLMGMLLNQAWAAFVPQSVPTIERDFVLDITRDPEESPDDAPQAE